MKKHQYFIIAFIEGIAVMSCEFLGAKIMAPFYGTSLVVWTSVIGVTMFSLCLGYYLGGALSERYNGFKVLSWSVFGGSLGLLLMPCFAPGIMLFSSGFGLYPGTVLSSLLLITLPLVCFSTVNPILIKLAVGTLNNSGAVTGRVFAFSTIGAIIASLALGFYIIPGYGTKFPTLFIGGGLTLFLIVFSYKFLPAGKYYMKYFPSLVLAVAIIYFSDFNSNDLKSFKGHKIIFKSDGLLGQITVVDHFHGTPHRSLDVNACVQTDIDTSSGFSNLIYVHRIATASSIKPEGSRVLLIGMGGGSLIKEFLDLGFQIDVCELDKRMIKISEKYFNIPVSSVRIFIDDARHFIKTSKNKYDIIVLDLSLAETQPSHVYTLEAFKELKNLLTDDDAFIFVHNIDHRPDEMASKSIFRTIQEAGLAVKPFSTDHDKDDKLFMALLRKPNVSEFKVDRQNPCCKQLAGLAKMLEMITLDTQNALILRDDRPVLDVLHIPTAEYNRNLTIENFLSKQIGGKNN